jgi:hypothetical protein
LNWGSAPGQLIVGIVANVASILLVTTAAVLLLSVVSRRRRRLHKFFAGGRHWGGDVRIMMSNIFLSVPSGKGTPVDMGFSGATMTLGEQIHAQRLVEAVEGRPATRLLVALADQIGLDGTAGSLRCKLSVSPLRVDGAATMARGIPDDADDGAIGRELAEVLRRGETLVLVGGVVFNTLTRYVMGRSGEQSWFSFEAEVDPATGIAKRSLRAEASGPDGPQDAVFTCVTSEAGGQEVYTEYFFVQKVTDFGPDHSTIFICAGTSTAATVAAVEELTDWESLRGEFGDGAFAVLHRLETSKRKPWQLGDELRPDVWNVTRVWTPPRPPSHR